MHPFYRFYALVAVFLYCFTLVIGHSAPPRPLKRIAHPTTHAIDILPRLPSQLHRRFHHNTRSGPLDTPRLLHSDSFRLTLSAFDDVFHLHLRPNDDLIHPDARIVYHSANSDGTTTATHSVPLLRESVRAYWGEVISPHATSDRLRQDVARVLQPTGPVLGWARIIVHDQGDADAGRSPVYEGAFTVNSVVYHITSTNKYIRQKHFYDPQPFLDASHSDGGLVIWRDSDQLATHEEEAVMKFAGAPVGGSGRTCAHDNLEWNTNASLNPALRGLADSTGQWSNPLAGLSIKRDDIAGSGMDTNFIDTIGNNAGCPTEQRVVYMGVAADCEYVSTYGDVANATQQILNDWNSASALYKKTFNISLGILELQVQSPVCPTTTNATVPWNLACNASGVDLNDRLSLFSQWRGSKGDDGAGLWHLLSGCPTGSEIGIAWLATLCQQTSSKQGSTFVSGTGVTTTGRTEWQVVAHEIGHNFGAIHDCTSGCNSTSACCPLSSTTCDANAQFIMSPVAEATESTFSQCTLGNICSLIGGGTMNTSCLVTPSATQRTISLNQCGNGIVESGEDCDPGSGVNSTCCTSSCKFAAGAVCDPSNEECCTGSCQFAPSTAVCRAAKDATCDTAEMCTGSSGTCPSDVFAENGKSCGSNGLKCAKGLCTSPDLQCQQAGASMGLSKACGSKDDTSCRVSCQNPNNTDACVLLSVNLADGSSCGYGGTCSSGSCVAGSALDTLSALYTQNLPIAIPVTVVAGLFLIIILFCIGRCIYRCSRTPSRRADHRRLDSNTSLLGQHQRLGSDPRLAPPMRSAPLPTYSSVAPSLPRSAASRPTAQAHERRLSNIPSSLIPGSATSRSAASRGNGSVSSSRSGSSAMSSNRGSGGSGSLSSAGARSRVLRTRWVDETLYNGPRLR